MTRLAVVSGNAALPFALGSAGHEVVIVDDDHDVRWSEYVGAEVVVLDLDDLDASMMLVEDLAASAPDNVRVLLLAKNDPRWVATSEAPTDGVVVLPLPLTMPRLCEALERLVAGPALSSSSATPPRADRGAPRVEDGSDSVSPKNLPDGSVVGHETPAPMAEPPSESTPAAATGEEPERSSAAEQEHELPAGFATATVDYYATRARLDPPDADGYLEDIPSSVSAAPATVAPAEPRGVEPPPPRAISLARALSACIDDLASVADTASVAAAEARAIVPADAVAILVRDGGIWRVAEGIALRPLERRLELAADHWLTRQLSSSANGILLAGGEGRWSELYGVPLSERHHLLAAPLMPVGAILLMARDDTPFEEADLAKLAGLCDEAGHLLADAVDVRKLARQLSDFIDQEV
jgi:hypothetical protein